MIKETMTPTERTWAAIKLEPCDRVPVAPLMDVMFPSRHKGMTVERVCRTPAVASRQLWMSSTK